jgi:hypothetical protein
MQGIGKNTALARNAPWGFYGNGGAIVMALMGLMFCKKQISK